MLVFGWLPKALKLSDIPSHRNSLGFILLRTRNAGSVDVAGGLNTGPHFCRSLGPRLLLLSAQRTYSALVRRPVSPCGHRSSSAWPLLQSEGVRSAQCRSRDLRSECVRLPLRPCFCVLPFRNPCRARDSFTKLVANLSLTS